MRVIVKGAVLPSWFVFALLVYFVLSAAALGVLWLEVRSLGIEQRLLRDYTEGRIGGLPYRPPTEETQDATE